MEKESILKDRTIVGSPLTHLFSLGILMFVFWLALSGDFAVKFVVYGLITSAVVAWICYPLLLLPNADGTKKYFALGVSPIAFLCYSMWLLKELVLANIDVVKATVRPELRIDPKVIRFVFRSDNPMAKVLLANSITLTPGTVTINVTPEGIYEVHALTDGAAEGLLSGAMPRKVAALFGEKIRFYGIERGVAYALYDYRDNDGSDCCYRYDAAACFPGPDGVRPDEWPGCNGY